MSAYCADMGAARTAPVRDLAAAGAGVATTVAGSALVCVLGWWSDGVVWLVNLR